MFLTSPTGRIEPHHVDYIVQQLRTEVIPKLEQVSGRRYDEARLSENARLFLPKPRTISCGCWRARRTCPSPIDAYFGGVYYIGPIFTAFRGTSEGVEYYRVLREEIAKSVSDWDLVPSLPRAQWNASVIAW